MDTNILDTIKFYTHKLLNLEDYEERLIGRDNIKLLTYNLFLRPVVKNNESDYKYERLDVFSSLLADYDIICNQEVFIGLNKFKQSLVSMAAKAGFLYHVAPPAPYFWNREMIDSGLVILSRFPILEQDYLIYSKSVLDCCLAQKGALYAKIDINGNYLHLFNTHLQANYYRDFESYKNCINTKLNQLVGKSLDKSILIL